MKKWIQITVFTLGVSIPGIAQVGIGNPNPNAGTILDLTNTNNKSLLLPVPSVDPTTLTASSFNTAGMLFYYSDNLYLKTSTSVKVISPWTYDGTAANGISSASGTPVAIGMSATPSSPIRLQVADGAADVTATTTNGGIAVGSTSGNHLLIDSDELMAKTNATTAGTLKLQEESGTVEIRSTTADAGVTTILTAHGSIDAKGKVKENGNDLLPVGSIIMWSGTTVPNGWALCDGGSYALMDGSGNVTTPNLMDRFIVGADATNGTGAAVGSYASAATGGANTVALTVAEMPSHSHTGTIDPGGDHTHSYTSPGSNNNCWCACACTGSSLANPGVSATTGTSGNHTHTMSISSSGSGSAHENRPPYYALAFIYKL